MPRVHGFTVLEIGEERWSQSQMDGPLWPRRREWTGGPNSMQMVFADHQSANKKPFDNFLRTINLTITLFTPIFVSFYGCTEKGTLKQFFHARNADKNCGCICGRHFRCNIRYQKHILQPPVGGNANWTPFASGNLYGVHEPTMVVNSGCTFTMKMHVWYTWSLSRMFNMQHSLHGQTIQKCICHNT